MSDHAIGSGPRYHALDCVRAAAMLLGVFYHAILFRFQAIQADRSCGGWSRPVSPAALISSTAVMDWLHSFRMPLFFLVSGFFCRMMLGKYGPRRYLAKRWWRIGAPLVVTLFALASWHMAIQPRPMADSGRGVGPAPGQAGGRIPSSPLSLSPRSKSFDEGGDGSHGEAWREEVTAAEREWSGPEEPAGDPRAAPGGTQALAAAWGAGAAGSDIARSVPEVGNLAGRVLASRVHRFTLGYLWFLWYLLVFATIAPFVTKAFGWLLLRPNAEAADRLGRWSIRRGVVPLVLGLLSVPALMQTRADSGWSLGPAEGLTGVLFQYQRDMPFYLAYFLAGWWLYRLREGLPDVARLWLPSLIVGCVAFAAAGVVSGTFAAQAGLPHHGLVRLGGYTLSAVGSAYLAWGFLGFFQRHLDRPSRVVRHLADVALWVYLAHPMILRRTLRWTAPLPLPWWGQALLAAVLTMAAALLLFEIAVRPTPLCRLFGSARPRSKTTRRGATRRVDAGDRPRPLPRKGPTPSALAPTGGAATRK